MSNKTSDSSKANSSVAPPAKKYKVIQTPQDASLIPTFAMAIWLGWQGGVPYMVILAILIPSTIFRATIVGLLTLSLILPRNYPPKISEHIGNWIAHNAMKYFGMKVIVEDEESYVKYYSHEDPKDNRGIIFTLGKQYAINIEHFSDFLFLTIFSFEMIIILLTPFSLCNRTT